MASQQLRSGAENAATNIIAHLVSTAREASDLAAAYPSANGCLRLQRGGGSTVPFNFRTKANAHSNTLLARTASPSHARTHPMVRATFALRTARLRKGVGERRVGLQPFDRVRVDRSLAVDDAPLAGAVAAGAAHDSNGARG
eukprot:441830-Pleurochrysis_carterae.AAC.2